MHSLGKQYVIYFLYLKIPIKPYHTIHSILQVVFSPNHHTLIHTTRKQRSSSPYKLLYSVLMPKHAVFHLDILPRMGVFMFVSAVTNDAVMSMLICPFV